MAYKPEIQYVGQFYVHGSEARQLAEQPKKKKARTSLPMQRLEKIRKVYVDPLAMVSLLVALVLLVTMAFGAIHLQQACHEMAVAKQYVFSLEKVNRQLEYGYRSSYDLEEVRLAAEQMGLVPVDQLQTMQLAVTVPQPEPEPTLWDDLIWFVKGLFA